MSRKTEKLTFFCQLCDESIEGNICPTHGIDFVTIKKIAVAETPPPPKPQAPPTGQGQEPKRVNGMLQIEQQSASKPVNGEKRLATTQPSARQAQKEAYLPVIPANSDPRKTLTPVEPTNDAPPPQNNAPQPDMTFQNQPPQEQQYYQQQQQQPPQSSPEAPPTPTYYAEQAQKTPPKTAAPPKSNKTLMIAAISIVAIILIAGAAFFMLDKPGSSPTSLYSEAESYYASQNYPQALQLYTQLVEEHPDNPLAPVVREKIKQLNQQVSLPVNVVAEDQQKIQEWMVSANLTFQSQRLLRPKNDNAVAHLHNILAIDPNYTPAIEMRDQIIGHFEQLAETAVKKGQFNDSISYYQMILEIKPNDHEVLKKMRYVLEQKSALTQQ